MAQEEGKAHGSPSGPRAQEAGAMVVASQKILVWRSGRTSERSRISHCSRSSLSRSNPASKLAEAISGLRCRAAACEDGVGKVIDVEAEEEKKKEPKSSAGGSAKPNIFTTPEGLVIPNPKWGGGGQGASCVAKG